MSSANSGLDLANLKSSLCISFVYHKVFGVFFSPRTGEELWRCGRARPEANTDTEGRCNTTGGRFGIGYRLYGIGYTV